MGTETKERWQVTAVDFWCGCYGDCDCGSWEDRVNDELTNGDWEPFAVTSKSVLLRRRVPVSVQDDKS